MSFYFSVPFLRQAYNYLVAPPPSLPLEECHHIEKSKKGFQHLNLQLIRQQEERHWKIQIINL